MKLVFFCVKAFFVFMLFNYCYCEDDDAKGPKRSRLAIHPFPRVGRSNYATWDLDSDVGEILKRSKSFIPMPRTGRAGYMQTGNQELSEKRSGTKNMNTGLWFGPRLGRLQKRDNPFKEGPWAYLLFGEAPILRDIKYTPRLGRESDEIYEDAELPISIINERTA